MHFIHVPFFLYFFVICTDETVDAMRGTWFYQCNSEPLDESIATQIETEHFAEFGGQKTTVDAPPTKAAKQGN